MDFSLLFRARQRHRFHQMKNDPLKKASYIYRLSVVELTFRIGNRSSGRFGVWILQM
jgi:hypothetical protein